LLVTLLLALAAGGPVKAADAPGWQVADTIQKAMQKAQVAFFGADQAAAQTAVAEALDVYTTQFAPLARAQAPDAVAAGETALRQAVQAVQQGDQPGMAAAGGAMQTAFYQVGYEQALAALDQGDADGASQWLLLRAFRQTSRFERLNSDATQALAGLRAGKISAADARQTVQVDLLDTYQARLTVALHDLRTTDTRALSAGRAQNAALAAGYFAILAPAYQEQRGAAALGTASKTFAALRDTARSGQSVKDLLPQVDTVLSGFRAAPLSTAEQSRRAGQLLRFIALVPVEYARGVKEGQVTVALEIQEAATFRDGAAAAFNDLRSLLDTRDAATTQQVAEAFDALEQQLLAAKDQSHIASPADIQAGADQIARLLKQTMPAEWQTHDTGADFDVIDTALDQMEQAVKAGEYDLAESARLEAYAILESGPEAKLVVFAPQMKQPIEDLFWYGAGEHPGLAALIGRKAPAAEILASRQALDAQLTEAQQALAGMNNAPVAIASNAAVIVFREGLEAVLILASLFGSMKMGAQRTLRRPLWVGTVMALIVTVITWLLAQGLLTTLASYGERLEAVVSLIAIAVLLLITNWFFHDVYWTGWMANFHRQKKRIIGGEAGQFLGLVLLGFSSIYREGFETVLFLQALVLEAGTATVLGGVAVGLAGTLLIGLLVFVVQAKLPHKKMLTFTGILIGAVLLQMVGNTVHVLQVVGWLPIHPIDVLTQVLPYWTGLWLGVYATWEGLLLQVAAGAFTIGSYFLAEKMHKHELKLAT
jgi:high-affinity iron transporter